MKTAKLNAYQKRALERFQAAYIALCDAGVGLIAHQSEQKNVALYAYSCDDLAEPVTMEIEANAEYLETDGYESIIDDLDDVEFFDVDNIMIEDGFQPYAKFKEEE